MISKNIQRAMLKANHVGAESKGFPYLAECLRQEGIVKNIWHLPSGDSFYFSETGSLVNPGNPLIGRVGPCPDFDQIALVQNIRANQAGKISFPEFLASLWKAGVIRYEVDFTTQQMSYFGAFDQVYQESYPSVAIDIFRESSFTLSDGFPEEDLEKYKKYILEIPGVRGVPFLRGRTYGANIFLDIVIYVDAQLSVAESHLITEEIERQLSEKFEVFDVDVHVEPFSD